MHHKIHQRFSKIWRKPAIIFFLVLMWRECVYYLRVYFKIITCYCLLMLFSFPPSEILYIYIYISSRVLLYVFKFSFSFSVNNGLEKNNNLKSDWSLVPDPFLFLITLSIKSQPHWRRSGVFIVTLNVLHTTFECFYLAGRSVFVVLLSLQGFSEEGNLTLPLNACHRCYRKPFFAWEMKTGFQSS